MSCCGVFICKFLRSCRAWRACCGAAAATARRIVRASMRCGGWATAFPPPGRAPARPPPQSGITCPEPPRPEAPSLHLPAARLRRPLHSDAVLYAVHLGAPLQSLHVLKLPPCSCPLHASGVPSTQTRSCAPPTEWEHLFRASTSRCSLLAVSPCTNLHEFAETPCKAAASCISAASLQPSASHTGAAWGGAFVMTVCAATG